MDLIIKAACFAANKHRDQRRKDRAASPYINHPLALADVLANECDDLIPENVFVAALLHDTIEDTKTTHAEIASNFGDDVLAIVLEVTDDKTLPKEVRKRLQIEHAPHLSEEAKLVKLADKICNLRDMADSPPSDWPLERIADYFDWAKAVVDGLRGTNDQLESLFDEAYEKHPYFDCATVNGLKVIYDKSAGEYWCEGYGFVFPAWFAGMNDAQELGAEVFNNNDECIAVLSTPAPNGKMPSAEDVARSFGSQLVTQLVNGPI